MKRLLLLVLGLSGLILAQSGCGQSSGGEQVKRVEAEVLQSKPPQEPKFQSQQQRAELDSSLKPQPAPSPVGSSAGEQADINEMESIEENKAEEVKKIEIVIEGGQAGTELNQTCLQMGLLVKPECSMCDEIPDTECLAVRKDSSGVQCFECQQEPESCYDIGLMEKEDCSFCTDIPDTVCQPDKSTHQGRQCYTCTEKPKKCSDMGLLDSAGCLECRSAPNMKCRPVESLLKEECFACVKAVEAEKPEVTPEVISKPDVAEVEKEIKTPEPPEVTPVEKNEPAETTEQKLGVEGFAEEVPEEAVSLPEPVPVAEKEDKMSCADIGQYSLDECGTKGCAACMAARQIDGSEQCYLCQANDFPNECLNNGHYRNCNQCRSEETCSPINVIVFEDGKKSPVMRCYDCLPAGQV